MGLLIRIHALGVDGALFFDLGPQACVRRTRGKPADGGADRDADSENDDGGQIQMIPISMACAAR
jgi:hypothetical protein